jgi:hypothetical protein
MVDKPLGGRNSRTGREKYSATPLVVVLASAA